MSYGDDPLAFVPSKILYDPDRPAGRWDPLDHGYRVLYTSDSLSTALVEVLFDLTPDTRAASIVADVEVEHGADTLSVDVKLAIHDYLECRTASVLNCPNVDLVKVDATQSLKMIAETFEIVGGVRAGDLLGSNLDLSRRASQIVYNEGDYGIATRSAVTDDGTNYAFFERNGSWMCTLTVHHAVPANDEKIALSTALETLGLS